MQFKRFENERNWLRDVISISYFDSIDAGSFSLEWRRGEFRRG